MWSAFAALIQACLLFTVIGIVPDVEVVKWIYEPFANESPVFLEPQRYQLPFFQTSRLIGEGWKRMKAVWITMRNVHGVGAQLVMLQLPRFVIIKSSKIHKLEPVGLVVAQSQAHQNNYDVFFFEWNIPSQLFLAVVLVILVLVVTTDVSIDILFLDVKRD